MPTDLCDILKQYKIWWDNEKDNHGDLWANTDKLFVQQNGNDMCGSTLSMWLGNWQKKYGLKRVTPHAIRHSVITLLIANNVDVKTVSARAGHSDVQTTLNIYTHYTKEADRQAANKIDTLLKIKND
jgi:integrase